MKTLAILSRKGGTGKTTLAVNLSVAAEQAGAFNGVGGSGSASFCGKMERRSGW